MDSFPGLTLMESNTVNNNSMEIKSLKGIFAHLKKNGGDEWCHLFLPLPSFKYFLVVVNMCTLFLVKREILKEYIYLIRVH